MAASPNHSGLSLVNKGWQSEKISAHRSEEAQPKENMKEIVREYWHLRKEMPQEAREKLEELVFGEPCHEIHFSGKRMQLLTVDGKRFSEIFNINRMFLYRGDFTAPVDENDYASSQNFVTEDGLAGFSISSHGWLTSFFSNYPKGGFTDCVKGFLAGKVRKLVCISTEESLGLVRLYEDCLGFKAVARTINDTKIMTEYYGEEFIESFIAHNGDPFHVFMAADKDGSRNGEIKLFEDYFVAEKYVDDHF